MTADADDAWLAEAAAAQAVERHAAALRRHVIDVIHYAGTHDPRSLQTPIGPSEIGHPCVQKIARKLAGAPTVNVPDPWRSIVGRAVHDWLARTFEDLDREAGGGRYLVEQPVDPGGPAGTSDLYVLGSSSLDEEALATVLDRLAGTVVDWKIVGLTSLREKRKHGPGQQYRVQLHTYGKGQRLAGERVEWVAMVCLPQSGALKDAYVWCEPYREDIADWALKRLADVTLTLAELDIEGHPERLAAFPRTPLMCEWCPYFLPGSTDPARGCPGDSSTERGRP